MKGRGALVAAGAVLAAMLAGRFIVPGRYRRLLEDAAGAEGVDANLLHAIQLTENPREDPEAIGTVNADGTRDYGLLQINVLNFPRLGLGAITKAGAWLPTTEQWKDPAANARAAAALLAANLRAAPKLTAADQLSVYNAGFSRDTSAGLRPKQDDAGGYFNGDYVRRGFMWYVLIAFSALLPVKRLGWEG